MPALEWSVEESPADADVERLVEGVTSHGRARARSDARPIACFVRSDGEVVAGACGRTELTRLFISYLWVEESRRGRGLGSKLLQQLEASAIARGCTDGLIETLLDEVANLYLRRGYLPLAIIPNFVGSFTRHILLKPFSAPSRD